MRCIETNFQCCKLCVSLNFNLYMRCIETFQKRKVAAIQQSFNLYMRCIETLGAQIQTHRVNLFLTYTWDVLKPLKNG